MIMKDGFYPALGTPTKENGELVGKSYVKEIDLMIASGAAGLLCMGSMGNMASLKNSEYPKVAKACVESASGRIPVMVGVMDCSVSRVLDRIEALDDIQIEGIVATVPFYYKLSENAIVNFYSLLGKKSKYPVYIYDLPSVTQSPLTAGVLSALTEIQNIKGMKTANMNLILDLYRNNTLREDFQIFYSGLDTFDAAIKSGIKKNLDGMFTCTPYNSKRMYEQINDTDSKVISKHLNNIITLRNLFLKEEVFPAYSYAMEILGCPGNYYPDYSEPVSDKLKEEIFDYMSVIKEI
jgi:4-hydroxy-tetrahydrodipicolinate synthase